MMQHVIKTTQLCSIQHQLREQQEAGMKHHTKPVSTKSVLSLSEPKSDIEKHVVN